MAETIESFDALVEEIAEAVHNAWWQQKLDDGWHYGKEFSVINKTHPDMKPYEMLTDNIKEYDRVTARTTISALLKRNYYILTEKQYRDLSAQASLYRLL